MSDKTEAALKEKLGDNESIFYNMYCEAYNDADNQANEQKMLYFRIQHTIIWLGFTAAAINIAITVLNATIAPGWLISVLAGVASLLTLLSTTLMRKRDFKKNFETWLRHRKRSMDWDAECRKYLLEDGDYSDSEEALKKFKSRFIEIGLKSNEEFKENMTKFDDSLGDK